MSRPSLFSIVAETKIEAREIPLPRCETPQFKRWFDGSKVMDDAGNPMVVYHGSIGFNGTQFEKTKALNRWLGAEGFYFSPSGEYASSYAQGEGGEVSPYFLSIKNPYRYGSTPNQVFVNEFRARLSARGYAADYITEKVEKFERTGLLDHGMLAGKGAEYTEMMRIAGYDGYQDGSDWVAFDSTQIKSALCNNGEFDPLDPRVDK